MSRTDPLSPAGGHHGVPVSPDRHCGRFWRRFVSWEFVRAHRLVPIVLGEHEQVAASLPIFFADTGAGLSPVALTRLTNAGTCALVSPGGQWRGSYVPSILRVHPFSARRDETGEIGLLVDEASGLVSDTGGDEPFFDKCGDPAPALRGVLDFFSERASAEHRTRAAISEIRARALLVPFTPPDSLKQMDAHGLLVPDHARIAGLGRTDLGVLHRCGALALLQVQAVSMHHLPFLAAVEAQLDRGSRPYPAPASARPGAAGGDAMLSGFLDALAQSRERDSGGAPASDDEKTGDVSKA
jgi:hypothetical protein